MNVLELTRDAQLGPLIEASRAEGFDFVVRLQGELDRGDFNQPGAALYGCAKDELVGLSGLIPDPYPDAEPGVGRLRHLYVLPQRRRQGIGQLLVDAVTETARRHYDVLRLRTTTPEAAHFYEALGFSSCAKPNATHYLNLK